MHIDHQTFERSFFYIGPGFDIQPLLRFTHLCDTFLYPNLYLYRRPVEGWYDEALANAADIEVLGKRVTSGFDADIALEQAPDRRASLDHAFSMTPHEFMNFFMAFWDARNHERYSITWQLRRRSTGRLLTLHFFTCEGLEAYAALSQLGRYAPRVLCTIETSVLESPRGMFNRFFTVADRAQPLLWVRGFQPTGSGNDFGVRRDSLDSVGVFPVRAMPFNHRWTCGHSYDMQMTDERYCAGFVTKRTAKELRSAEWDPRFRNERHSFTTEGIEIGLAAMAAGDVAVMPRRLIDRFAANDRRAHAWEKILGDAGHALPAGEQIAALRTFIDRLGVLSDAVIHLVPWCLEDENEPYRDAVSMLSQRTITHCPALADLLDLKGVAPLPSRPTAVIPEFNVAHAPIMPVLDRVNVASSDDSRRFLDTTRLDAIECVLREAQSQWTLAASGPLFRFYARAGSSTADHPVLVSSHADSTYAKHFHEPLEDPVELLGTFDNSITNALVLELMLADHLPENVLVAFTGDEESESRGAAEVIAHLRGAGRLPRAVIVLDITDDRFYGSPCTLENYFANGTLGLPTSETEFLDLLRGAFDRHVPSVHHDDAWADESWRYEEEGVHVVSLCVPTTPADPGDHGTDWMHSSAGVRIRADLLPVFGDSLARVARVLAERGSVTAAALETTC